MRTWSHAAAIAAFVIVSSAGVPAWAGDRLLATGGVSNVEGSAGGGLSPWALIAGYGTREQTGATAMFTRTQYRAPFTVPNAGSLTTE